MAADVNIIVNAVDNFSSVLGNFGNIVTGIKSAVDLVADAFRAASDAVEPFVESAMDSQVTLALFDQTFATTSQNAGMFTETVGQLSNVQLSSLYDQLQHAKDKLAEMKDEFGNARTYTEQESIALAAQHDIIANLTAQIQRGTDGLTIYRDTTKLTRDELIQLSESMMNATGFSDELELSAEAMMLRFENVNSHIFPQAIQLANDLARAMGIDLVTAAQTVGRALDDPEQGIGRLNMQFKLFNDTEMETIKNMAANGDIAGAQALIMERLQEKVGGAADAYAHTFAGALDIAKEKLDNMQEVIGGPILDVLGRLLSKLVEFAETNPIIQGVLGFFTRLHEILQNPDVPFLGALGAAMLNLEGISPILSDLGTAIMFFQGGINTGMTWFDSFNLALDYLEQKWPNSPLLPVLERVQEFLHTAQTEGWGAAIRDLFGDAWDYITQKLPEKVQGLIDTLAGSIGASNTSGLSYQLGIVIGNALTEGLRIAGNALSTVVQTIDWTPLGTAMRTALSQIWQGMTQDGSLRQEFIRLIVGDYWASPGNHDPVWEALYNLGKSALEGFVAGLNSFEVFTAQWIDEHLTQPVKRFLGIASPSTVFFGIGKDILQGLWDGIADTWTNFATWFETKITNLIKNLSWDNIIKVITGQMSISDLFGSSGGSTGGGQVGGGTVGGTAGTGPSSSGLPTAGLGGPVVYQYFAGATINVGSWDEITYDCIYPNPFVAATSNQLPSGGGGGGLMR